VKHLAYVDAVREELVAGRIDVVNREDHAVDRARRGGGDALAEDDRRVRCGWREVHEAIVIAGGDVGVNPHPRR
jgi:hypothetical protein